MMFNSRMMAMRDIRVAWIGVFVVLCLGYIGVVRSYERQVWKVLSVSERSYARIVSDREILAQAVPLRERDRLIRADVANITSRGQGATMGQAVRWFDHLAHRLRVHIVQIRPRAAPAGAHAGLAAMPVGLTVEGRFAPLLAFVETLSAGNPLIDVHPVAFDVSDPNGRTVIATIQIDVMRVTALPTAGEAHHAAAR
ncbi:MAG: hypothetical protein ACYDA5_03015 [Vulcanimicrobiaceae bacterium]